MLYAPTSEGERKEKSAPQTSTKTADNHTQHLDTNSTGSVQTNTKQAKHKAKKEKHCERRSHARETRACTSVQLASPLVTDGAVYAVVASAATQCLRASSLGRYPSIHPSVLGSPLASLCLFAWAGRQGGRAAGRPMKKKKTSEMESWRGGLVWVDDHTHTHTRTH